MKENSYSNLDKVFWPEDGYTKGDVIDYYRKMSPVILPYLKDRPEALNRHPNGIRAKGFFQKNAGSLKLPLFVKTRSIRARTTEKQVRYVLCNNVETLLYLANLGCIEINPWSSRVAHLDKPDFMTIDLDPHGREFDEVIAVAQVAHRAFDEIGVKNYVKTSGKTGMHIVVPLGARYPYEKVREFARQAVARIHTRVPNLTSIEQRIKKRGGRIYLDYMRNSFGQTVAAPYSLRPWPDATVSTPLDWKEVRKGLKPAQFNIKTIFTRLKKRGDLWQGMLTQKTDLRFAKKRLYELAAEEGRASSDQGASLA